MRVVLIKTIFKFLSKMARKKQNARKKRMKKGLMPDQTQQSHEGQSRGREGTDPRPPYEPIELLNPAFENFYKMQGLVPEAEWPAFMEALRQPLPVVFRVTGFKSQREELLKMIKSKFFTELADVEIDGIRQQPPESLKWYPDQLAWQVNSPRSAIRKFPALKKLHTFLISETECGNISRQEAVSMIPPLLMDIKPHHKILDLCAAPGSKTAQLIEMLHQDETINVPDGFVIANDTDNKRCYLMVHQVKRLQSPCFMIINHDASQLPNFWTSSKGIGSSGVLRYDRILADVPCSGDGTMRKNMDIWKKWKASNGAQLHTLQRSILRRGLELLKIGGRLVYSTCSFNPMENEAVIASTLQACGDSVELVDVSSTLPDLKTVPGLTKWTILENDGKVLAKFEDAPKFLRKCYQKSVFPPADVDHMHLERCMRVLPHHQNTGGFFIAVLTKTKTLPWQKQQTFEEPSILTIKPEDLAKKCTRGFEESCVEPKPPSNSGNGEAVAKAEEGFEESNVKPESPSNSGDGEAVAKVEESASADASADGATGDLAESQQRGEKRKGQQHGDHPPKKKYGFSYKEDPFIWFRDDEPLWPPIKQFYGISDDFPVSQCLVRTETGKKRSIYFGSQSIKTLAFYNDSRIKIINLGIKALSRSESPYTECDFRLTQEAINTMYSYVSETSERIMKTCMEDIVTLLSNENPFFFKFTDAFKERVEPLTQGCLILVYEPDGRPDALQCKLIFTAWRGKTSVRSFVPKYERSHYLRLCGVELKDKDDTEDGATGGGSQESAEGESVKKEESSEMSDGIPVTDPEEEAPPPDIDESATPL